MKNYMPLIATQILNIELYSLSFPARRLPPPRWVMNGGA